MNNRTRLLTLVPVIAGAMVPAIAVAHPGHGVSGDFMAGVVHPLSGLDHVLMIVAISAWASLLAPAGRVVVATCLAAFVALGAAWPVSVSGSLLEAAIALTVVGAGILLAFGRRWPLWATGAVAAMFAVIHGFAHGVEGPAGSVAYVPGLALSTGGVALGVSFLAARLQSGRGWLRIAGIAGATAGVTALITA